VCSVTIAVASTKQFLYKRSFEENKWKLVGESKCRAQVAQKGQEFYLKINDGIEVINYCGVNDDI
jgi:hypothetical protein